jgi:SAM-dependent methyltransferase
VSEWWEYENLESGYPYNWNPATRGDHPDDNIDFHVDLGAGTLRKGRLTLDLRGNPDIQIDLNKLGWANQDRKYRIMPHTPGTLPFLNDSIESMISHHCLEHIGDGFVNLIDECYRVLKPGGKFRIIVPLFPSFAAVDDVDHCRYFTIKSFECFVHDAPLDVPFWSEAFSSPYTKARFRLTHKDYTPPEQFTTPSVITVDKLFEKGREIRVTLQKPTEVD